MSHELALVVSNYEDVTELLNGKCGDCYGACFDYYDFIKDLIKKKTYLIGWKGLIVKDEKKYANELYEVNGKNYASKAEVKDVDWEATEKVNMISAIIDTNGMVDEFDFDDGKDFWKFVYKKIKNYDYAFLVDVHC